MTAEQASHLHQVDMTEVANIDVALDGPLVDGLFRPLKRRRHYRRRSDEVDLVAADSASTPVIEHEAGSRPESVASPAMADATDEDEPGKLSVAEVLRLRKQLRSRRGGVEFVPGKSESASAEAPVDNPEMAAVERGGAPEEIAAIVNRFAPQTGQVADVNKHMMSYIDSELARLHHGESGDAAPGPGTALSGDAGHKPVRAGHIQRQPATLGKLHEIDLGPDTKRRNIERTEAAQKRAAGEDFDESVEDGGKPRLGRDGKPWRGRKRRTSEDVRRDKLVEEVLRESRIELYDEPEAGGKGDDSQAADDRIAEQFRRDFLDAISTRHRRRFGGNKSAAAKAKKDDRPKGPKLGGSRSARAAMREQQAKTGKR